MRNRKLWIAVGLKIRKALLFNTDQKFWVIEKGEFEQERWELGSECYKQPWLKHGGVLQM